MDELNDWAKAAGLGEEAVTLDQMDEIVRQYLAAREEYEKAKKFSNEKHAEYSAKENMLVNTLKAANKKSYKVDGIGQATIVVKNVIQVPKTTESKRDLWAWIKEKYGVDVLDDMLSINSQKLTSWYNQEAEANKADPLFSIPGIDAPTSVEHLSFTRAK